MDWGEFGSDAKGKCDPWCDAGKYNSAAVCARRPHESLGSRDGPTSTSLFGTPRRRPEGHGGLTSMPEVGPDAAVEFSDWIYEAEQAIGSLSDRAALWFSACLGGGTRDLRHLRDLHAASKTFLDARDPTGAQGSEVVQIGEEGDDPSAECHEEDCQG